MRIHGVPNHLFLIRLLGCTLLLALVACSGLRVYKHKLPCYTGINPGLDTLINIHGFYRQREIRDMRGIQKYDHRGQLVEMGIDTSYSHCMFFEDGMFIMGFSYYHERPDSMAAYLTRQALAGKPISYTTSLHGTYTVHGDTIKVRMIQQGGTFLWGGWEIWYRIIDRNTIVDFYRAQLHVSFEDRNKENYQPTLYRAEPARFIPLGHKPESQSWLKDEDWFTCTGKNGERWRKRKK